MNGTHDAQGKSQHEGPKRLPMVNWYNPAQLIKTGVQVTLSKALGTRYDFRNLEALQQEQETFDYTVTTEESNETPEPVNEIWFDYVADLGDGWQPTFAIASLLAQESLTVRRSVDTEQESECHLPRGRFLIMGGDQVYPVASRQNYEERLVAPYRQALPEAKCPPHLFTIPGNHDWYDGLVSFMRLFCQERWIGGWKTRQKRSYFALKLPHRWWLWAVDIQLESDIDLPQLEYFKQQAQQFEPGTRIILCTAVPDWIYGISAQRKTNLAFLEDKIVKDKDTQVYLTLAGDLHHYRRHEKSDDVNVQKITSGGGGAFLHPTHGPKVDEIHVKRETGYETYRLQSAFPTPGTSFWLTFQALFFPYFNPRFGITTAIAYLMTDWLRPPKLAEFLAYPASIVWVVFILGIFYFYAKGRVFRILGGGIHGLAHLAASFALSLWLSNLLGESASTVWGLLLKTGGMLLGGYIVGSILMGIYLFLALNLFRQHPNEAFSALKIKDYKHFLRLHVTPEGHLEIYPIGLEKVNQDVQRNQPHLIESAIRIVP